MLKLCTIISIFFILSYFRLFIIQWVIYIYIYIYICKALIYVNYARFHKLTDFNSINTFNSMTALHMSESSPWLCLVICLANVSSANIFLGMCPTTLLSHSFSYTSQQQRMLVVAAYIIVHHGDSTVVLQ